MSLTVPLAVRFVTTKSDRHITRDLRRLSFRETAIGGFASAAMSLDRPLRIQPDEIAYYGRVIIYAGGTVIWEGLLEDPGRSVSDQGEVWDLTAMGPAARAKDRCVPLIYVDTRLTEMYRSDNATPGGSDSVGGDPGSTTDNQEALVLRFPDGLHVGANSRVVARYLHLMDSFQQVARLDYTWDAGRSTSTVLVEGLVRTDGASSLGDNVRSQNASTSGGASSAKVIGTDWVTADNRTTAEVRIFWNTSSTTIGDDTYWVSFRNLTVQGTRYSKAGVHLTTAASYTTNTVLASQVVADLLGRLLTSYDGANAVIDTTSHAIDQIAYPDGITPAEVLDDLMIVEPSYRWGAYETNPSTGKSRFEWKQWPSTVRYEADVTDGYTAPGSADGLYNAVSVRWTDTRGRVRRTQRTSTVAALTAAGLTRQATIDLGDNIGSSAEADRAGDQYLAEHNSAPNAGTLTIARPILDIQTGRMVYPYEIKPGNLIRVRGILPRVDALNASARDGVTVFRIFSREYDTDRAAATLELDSYARRSQQDINVVTPSQFKRRR